VVAEGRGQSDKVYYTLGPGAIGGIICRDENGTKYWYHYDRLGNVVGVTNAYGSVASLYTMDAFGNVLEKGNSGYLYEHSTDPQPYHLTTKEYDPDARLYYFSARWYDPETGRFISRDPDAEGRWKCPYQYVFNAPTSAMDPKGTKIVIFGGTLAEQNQLKDAWSQVCRIFEMIPNRTVFMEWTIPGGYNPMVDITPCLKECFKRYCKGQKNLSITVVTGGWCTNFLFHKPEGYAYRYHPQRGIYLCTDWNPGDWANPAYSVESIAHELAHICGATETEAYQWSLHF